MTQVTPGGRRGGCADVDYDESTPHIRRRAFARYNETLSLDVEATLAQPPRRETRLRRRRHWRRPELPSSVCPHSRSTPGSCPGRYPQPRRTRPRQSPAFSKAAGQREETTLCRSSSRYRADTQYLSSAAPRSQSVARRLQRAGSQLPSIPTLSRIRGLLGARLVRDHGHLFGHLRLERTWSLVDEGLLA